jgi:thiol-disulfide isomerase/thioredoxin
MQSSLIIVLKILGNKFTKDLFSLRFTSFISVFILCMLASNVLLSQEFKVNDLKLTGTVSDKSLDKIYFVYYNSYDRRFLDSVKIENGYFKINIEKIGFLDKFFIKLTPNNLDNNDSLNNVRVPIEGGKLEISLTLGKFSEYKLIGCNSCAVIDKYKLDASRLQDTIITHEALLDDSSISNETKRLVDSSDNYYRKMHANKWLNYCRLNLNKNETPFLLFELATSKKLLVFSSLFLKLTKSQKTSFYGVKLKRLLDEFNENVRAEKFARTKLLNKSPFLFAGIDWQQNKFDLKNYFKNGYIILDFWASWCKPCRKSHPAFNELYLKYKQYKLSVIAISADENVQAWRDAILTDKTNQWPNVLNIVGTSGYDLTEKFNIQYFPTKILIAPSGRIAGIYVGEEDFDNLKEKLRVIFKD